MRPFAVDWTADAFDAVLDRVRAYRFPLAPPGEGWRHGCDAAFLRAFRDRWIERYDRRGAVARLNRFPQFVATIDGVDIHFVHVKGEANGTRPLLLTHGWPGAHREFWQVIEPLAYPSRHGGDSADAFDLVIPSLPNFGFSAHPAATIDPRGAAALLDRLMVDVLGHRRYRAHGGDWGALVTAQLALAHADHLDGIHLTMLFPLPGAAPEGEAEIAWAARQPPIERALGGYRHLQATKPQSLSWLAADSPVGQAAWILERFHDWADLRDRSFDAAFAPDDLLDIVMIYVMTEAFHSSIRFYAAAAEADLRTLRAGQRIDVPTAFACFPDPLHPWPPRSFAEKGYAVSRWTVMPRGGHFAALEAPDLLVADLRAFGRGAA